MVIIHTQNDIQIYSILVSHIVAQIYTHVLTGRVGTRSVHNTMADGDHYEVSITYVRQASL